MSLSRFLECIAVLMLQIATVFGRASTRLRYSRSPDREVPNRSSTGASKWQSWRLSFVAEVTNEDHATQERCDRIFLHQWWILPPHSVHSADVAWGPCWHHIIDCCSSQADLPRTPVPTYWLHQSSKSLWWPTAASTRKKHERQVAVTWSRMVSWLSKWTPRLDTVVEKWTFPDNSWSSTMSTLASCCRDPIHITCVFSAFILSLLQLIHALIFSVQLTNRWTAVSTSEAPVLRWTCVSSAYEWAFMSSLLMISSNSAV